MRKIITHDGDFHADDVFAVATTQIYLEKQGLILNKDFEIIRVNRDQDFSIFSQNDIIMDIGFIYDKEKNRLDHHQNTFTKTHDLHSIPYASFGLVWDKFGLEICNNNQVVFEEIERKLVLQIDGVDNGVATSIGKFPEIPPFTWDLFIRSFYPTIEDQDNLEEKSLNQKFNEGFLKIKDFVKEFLIRIIAREKELINKKTELEEMVKNEKNIWITNTKNHKDVKILIMEKFWNWKYAYLLPENHDFHFIIYSDKKNNYKIHGLKKSINDMTCRISPPTEWLGKRDEELENISNIKGFIFCHKGGFLMSATSREVAIEIIKNI